MKILQFGKYYPPVIGGIETVMFDITEGLNGAGITCDVLCSNDKNEFVVEDINGYRVYRTKSYGKVSSTSMSPQLITKLKEICNKYDIIHVHHPDPMACMALFLIRPKQKIVLHWHSDIVKQKLLLKFYMLFQNWLVKRADIIIGTTPKYIKYSKYINPYTGKTFAVPIGIDKNRQKADPVKVKEIKGKYKNKKIVFALGRLEYYKGFEFLIDAAKHLNEKYVILIGGSGSLFENFQDQIAKDNLENKVALLGKIDDSELGSFYKACDVYCMSSVEKSEAFGVVLLEAMSFGKPIVAADIPGSGVGWVNEHKKSGLNVPVRDPGALAKAIDLICSDKKIYNDYSGGSKQRFLKNFTSDIMIKKVIDVYNKVLS